jgi:hypothetical protein
MFGLSKDALHIYVGLTLFFLVAFAARKKIGSATPFIAVLLVALLGEAVDAYDDVRSLGIWRWRASVHDVLNTIAWPLVISLIARTRVFPKS